jgi:hypothetical protein
MEKLNPIQLFVEGVKEFAEVKDPDMKKALFKLGEVVASDSVLADYDPSSDAITAAENFKVELGELEARMLAETEQEIDVEIDKEEEEDILPVETEDEDEDVPLLIDEEEEKG